MPPRQSRTRAAGCYPLPRFLIARVSQLHAVWPAACFPTISNELASKPTRKPGVLTLPPSFLIALVSQLHAVWPAPSELAGTCFPTLNIEQASKPSRKQGVLTMPPSVMIGWEAGSMLIGREATLYTQLI